MYAMTIHFCPRPLNDHWPDAFAAWRSRADYDAVESNFAAEWRAHAFAIWRATRPAKGTPAEVYLKSRGLRLSPPASIRFHVKLEHFAGGAWPAMCAMVTDSRSGLPLGVHAIFLSRDGSSLAPIRQPAATFGICDGGVVRLGEPSGQPTGVLMVGVELLSCLKVMQDTGDAAWATLTQGGLAELDLPANVRSIIILAGDTPDAAQAAAWKWKSQKRRAVIVAPLLEAEVCGCPHPHPHLVTDAVH
jgi:putative DNA primase/helicase